MMNAGGLDHAIRGGSPGGHLRTARVEVAQEPPAPKKASAAQLKRDGEDARIKAEINACDPAGIAEWGSRA